MVFKNKRDQEFFLALRAAGLTRNKAFQATVRTRKSRMDGHAARFTISGLLWSDIGVSMEDGRAVIENLYNTHTVQATN